MLVDPNQVGVSAPKRPDNAPTGDETLVGEMPDMGPTPARVPDPLAPSGSSTRPYGGGGRWTFSGSNTPPTGRLSGEPL